MKRSGVGSMLENKNLEWEAAKRAEAELEQTI